MVCEYEDTSSNLRFGGCYCFWFNACPSGVGKTVPILPTKRAAPKSGSFSERFAKTNKWND